MYRNVINYWIPYSVVKNRQHTELRPWHLPAVSPTSLIPWSLFPLSAARPEEVRSDGRCKGSDDLAKQRSCHLHFRGPQKDWRSSSLRYMSDGHWWSLMVIDGHWWSLMVYGLICWSFWAPLSPKLEGRVMGKHPEPAWLANSYLFPFTTTKAINQVTQTVVRQKYPKSKCVLGFQAHFSVEIRFVKPQRVL